MQEVHFCMFRGNPSLGPPGRGEGRIVHILVHFGTSHFVHGNMSYSGMSKKGLSGIGTDYGIIRYFGYRLLIIRIQIFRNPEDSENPQTQNYLNNQNTDSLGRGDVENYQNFRRYNSGPISGNRDFGMGLPFCAKNW